MAAVAQGKILEGVFAINKPPSISSAALLRNLQSHFNPSRLFAPLLAQQAAAQAAAASSNNNNRYARHRRRQNPNKGQVKLGHGGTLDPLATGVLVVGLGRGTKELQRFLECSKAYECVVLVGLASDTYDRLGKVVARDPDAGKTVTRERVEEALERFRGRIMQRPPVYSALRFEGKRFYEYAREGKEIPIDIPERPVSVLDLEMVEWWDAGEHSFKGPDEVAETDESAIARKIMQIDGESPQGTKRKREEAEKQKIDEEAKDCSVKKQKLSEEEPSTAETTIHTIEPSNNGGTIQKSPVHTDTTTKSPALIDQTTKSPTPIDQSTKSPTPVNRCCKKSTTPVIKSPAPADQTIKSPAPDGQTIKSPTPIDQTIKSPATINSVTTSPAHFDIATPSSKPSTPPLTNDTTTSTANASPTSTSPLPYPAARLRMTVTTGFYVRSLCHDLGAAVGSYGLMSELKRTRQGDFELDDNVLEFADLDKGEAVWGPKVEEMLDAWNEDADALRTRTHTERDSQSPRRSPSLV